MSLFSKAVGIGAGVVGGASPWLLAGLFVGGLLIGGGIAGTAAYKWQQREIDGLTVALSAKTSRVLELEGKVQSQATELLARDATIHQQNTTIDGMLIEAKNASDRALRLIDESNQRVSTTEAKLAKLKRDAANASDVDKPKAISPSARAGYDWLRCRAALGPAASAADAAACSE